MQALYAPGTRVVVRHCEWLIRRADRNDDNGYILTVDGLSELVNGKSACFLTQLDPALHALKQNRQRILIAGRSAWVKTWKNCSLSTACSSR